MQSMQGGDSGVTGDDPTASGGVPTDVTLISDSSLIMRPGVAQFLKKFTSFCYQIANGMVSVVI